METDHIRALEVRLRLATLHSDLEELNELLADDLVFISQNGQLWSKTDDLNIHRTGRQVIDAIDTSEMKITLTQEAAIVVVKARVTGHFDGHKFSGIFRYSRVWLERGGKWQVASAHCSAVVTV